MTIPRRVFTISMENGEKEEKLLKVPLDMYSDEQRKRYNADSLARSFLLEGISEEICINLNIKEATANQLWDQLENKSRAKNWAAENSALKRMISDLEAQIQKQESVEMKSKDLESTNANLQKKISEFEKKFSDFSKKSIEEKKVIELKSIKFSQQVSNFEKVIILERDQFAKENKAFDQKNIGFLKEITDGRKGGKKEFEKERSTFEAAIRKLNAKLSELSKFAQKEKKKKCDLEMKIDLLVKEINGYSSKINELEKIISMVVVTEHKTPESIVHSPRDDSADSECSFKSVASSTFKPVSSKRSVKSSDQIRNSNLFFDRNIDGSGTHQRRRYNYKEAELVWNRKPVEAKMKYELKCKNSCVHTPNAKKNNAQKGKPDFVYTRDKLISLSGKKFYCSYCRTHDPVHKTSDHYWYGSYSVTPIRTATNTHGPKYQWVPKKRDDSVLQAPTVKGE
ncbi:hypothetical protein L6452_05376 [Arctium lappa]|uniref:Uncharacterized protein n=1 Tax=Arctium lappa TaxID=4217 RepID=A0ACB9EGW4_ARCLA|nr:hypothetical protein L6452_05376 [Arctium lappa]